MSADTPANLFTESKHAARRRADELVEPLGALVDWTTPERMALGCRFLARDGHGGTLAGQVTTREEDSSTFWTTDWSSGFADARASSMIRIDSDMNVVEGTGSPNPAVRFHLWIYNARPQTHAIVHSHPPYASALSMVGEDLAISHMDTAMFYDDCARLERWPGLPVANEEGEVIAEALGDKRSILLAHHGLLTTGSSLDEALYLACLLERACQMQIRARAVGVIRELDPALAAEAREFLLKPKLVSGTVDYWLKQIARGETEALS